MTWKLSADPGTENMQKDSGFPLSVAIIMDGNGRWAEQRGLPRIEGHRAGLENFHPIVKSLKDAGGCVPSGDRSLAKAYLP